MTDFPDLASMESLQTKRARLYTDFMLVWAKSFERGKLKSKALARPDPELARELNQIYMQITLVGSDLVIESINELQNIATKVAGTRDLFPLMAQFGRVCLEMRKELNPGSQLTELDILRIFIQDIDAQPRLKELLSKKIPPGQN